MKKKSHKNRNHQFKTFLKKSFNIQHIFQGIVLIFICLISISCQDSQPDFSTVRSEPIKSYQNLTDHAEQKDYLIVIGKKLDAHDSRVEEIKNQAAENYSNGINQDAQLEKTQNQLRSFSKMVLSEIESIEKQLNLQEKNDELLSKNIETLRRRVTQYDDLLLHGRLLQLEEGDGDKQTKLVNLAQSHHQLQKENSQLRNDVTYLSERYAYLFRATVLIGTVVLIGLLARFLV